MDAEERACLLNAFNATDLAPSDLLHPGQTLHGLLEHWAAATPDKTAVTFEASTCSYSCSQALFLGGEPKLTSLRRCCGAARCAAAHAQASPRSVAEHESAQGAALSYGELDKRANQLAHRLVALGVGREVPVGVMMERSLELPVALLGVLKAGGAFVPMDPSYPPDRLAIMVEDSQVRMPACRLCPWRSEWATNRLYLWPTVTLLQVSRKPTWRLPDAQAPVILSQSDVLKRVTIDSPAHVLPVSIPYPGDALRPHVLLARLLAASVMHCTCALLLAQLIAAVFFLHPVCVRAWLTLGRVRWMGSMRCWHSSPTRRWGRAPAQRTCATSSSRPAAPAAPRAPCCSMPAPSTSSITLCRAYPKFHRPCHAMCRSVTL